MTCLHIFHQATGCWYLSVILGDTYKGMKSQFHSASQAYWFWTKQECCVQDFRTLLASRRHQSAGSRLQCPGGSTHDTHVLVVLHMYMWCVCSCVWAHMCIWVCVSMCMFVLKPEDGIKCSSIPIHFIYWGRVLHWVWGLLIAPAYPWNLVCLLHTGIIVSSHVCLASVWVPGDLSFCGKCLFTHYVPSSCLSIWKLNSSL